MKWWLAMWLCYPVQAAVLVIDEVDPVGAVMVSNSITFSSLGSAANDYEEAVTYQQWLGTSFVADADAEAVKVDQVTLRISTTTPNQHLIVGITGSKSMRPDLDNILVEMESSSLNQAPFGTVQTLSLSPIDEDLEVVLNPGETYWLIVGVEAPDVEQTPSSGLYHWSYASDAGPFDSGRGWRVGDQIATSNTAGQNWTPSNNTPYSFGVSLSAIPEPSATLLCMIGMAFSMATRRRVSSSL